MRKIVADANLSGELAQRAEELFRNEETGHHRRTDRMFAWLMIAQWLAGIAAAFWISPLTWEGQSSSIHIHVWAAIFLGAVITGFPVILILTQPGGVLTRHAVAVGQMLTSALLIHLTGGRIETHFHVFGSLAFLAFYRDWKVLLTATIVVAADHLMRGIFWPQSVFGVLTASPWRWLEHAGWVLFEDIFLFQAIRMNLRTLRGLAERQARLESVNADIERQVAERTAELRKENAERERAEKELRSKSAFLEAQIISSMDGILVVNNKREKIFQNQRFTDLWKIPPDIANGAGDEERNHFFERQVKNPRRFAERISSIYSRPDDVSEDEIELSDGTILDRYSYPVLGTDGTCYGRLWTFRDISERKRAEKELLAAHQDLLATSRVAGMAEIATNVLHNVGNVLNSVNVSAGLVAESLRKSKVSSLGRVVDLLKKHKDDLGAFITTDPKGKQLPAYLAQLAEYLQASQDATVKELDSLHMNIEHIKDIVAMQQSYARVSGVKELVNLADLVEDSLRMNVGALTRHRVEIIRELEPAPLINIDKHKALQILINLVRNAKYACDESDNPDKTLTLRVTDGDGWARISVIDNGVGILPENMARIFNHGFTTRKGGHGFGLHSSALAAKELGGSLSVHSDGENQGATFVLELPLNPPESRHE